jgi:hypothetical protein
MRKPKLFIGSASESLAIVKALELELYEDAQVERWDLDTFRPGHFTLDELAKSARDVDLAVFVLGREDMTESREKEVSSPRDNVIFEAGMFTAALGRERTVYIVDSLGTKLPTDWAGLGYLTFDAAAERPRDKVLKAAAEIRKRIDSVGIVDRVVPGAMIVGHWWQYVVNADDGAVLSLMTISTSPTPEASFSLQGEAWSNEGERVARYRSRSAHFDPRARILHYSWDGEHPRDSSLPRHFGVGEIAFASGDPASQVATGSFSTSNQSDLSRTRVKATRYVRASPEDVCVFGGTERKGRSKIVQEKLRDRSEFDV